MEGFVGGGTGILNPGHANLALTSRAVNLFDEGYLSAFCKEVDAIAQTKGDTRAELLSILLPVTCLA